MNDGNMARGRRSTGMLRAMIALVALSWMAPAERTAAQPAREFDVADGVASTHVLVRFDHNGAARMAANTARRASGVPLAGMNAVALRVARRWGVTSVRPVYPYPFAYPELAARHGLDRYYLMDVPEGTDTPRLAAALRVGGSGIEQASCDTLGATGRFIPDDRDFRTQYNLDNLGQTAGTPDADIDAPEAWELHTGDVGTVTLAIIDTGINLHDEFTGRLIPGINTNNSSTPDDTSDGTGHGTHVAGIAAATGNNGIGIAGVTWGALLMPVRTRNASGFGSIISTAVGIMWAADNGADVANLSLQFYDLDAGTAQFFDDAVNYAHDAGVLLVAIAGNATAAGERRPVAYPARLANCMAVSATTDRDELAVFSNIGDEVDVAAPGDHIWSTAGDGGYEFLSGTSMASPLVAGLAALVKSFNPQLTNDEIRTILTESADDLGEPGRDPQFGYGRINAYRALLAARTPAQIVSSFPPDGAVDARQPSEFDGSGVDGWRHIELTFDGDVSRLGIEDFAITQHHPLRGIEPGPAIDALTIEGPDAVTLSLSEPIEPGAWTVITRVANGRQLCLGYLPGDVDQNGTSAASDIGSLIDCLNEVAGPCEPWKCEMRRLGDCSGKDIARLIDLLNGSGAYRSWYLATLGPSPCAPVQP